MRHIFIVTISSGIVLGILIFAPLAYLHYYTKVTVTVDAVYIAAWILVTVSGFLLRQSERREESPF